MKKRKANRISRHNDINSRIIKANVESEQEKEDKIIKLITEMIVGITLKQLYSREP
ncbi:hypothetical protein [Pedobacter sp. ASV28]|uniref:hypothetical protein n=1 Tax=Pedobacter sp. ASV28 TaxID=2795123 RepID=UPI0018EBA307|nr:hypothetical protein [Pedobacter sp. ASV28]